MSTVDPEGVWRKNADIEALVQRLEKEKRAAEHRANVAEPALTAETARANAMEARAEQAEASRDQLLIENKRLREDAFVRPSQLDDFEEGDPSS